ncbi:MAG: MerR family transcriptional regulator, partial [Chloroflexota bacterium]
MTLEPTLEMAEQEEELFTIGDLARELGTTTRTIRYYEECGLISPQRTDGNQRRYTRRERGRLKLIFRAKEAFTLDEIKELFQIYDEHPDELGEQQQFKRLCEMMERKIAQIDNQMAELAKLRSEVNVALEDIRSKIWVDGTEPT